MQTMVQALMLLASLFGLSGCSVPKYHVMNQTASTIRVRLVPSHPAPFSFSDGRWAESFVAPGQTVRLDRNRKPPDPLRQPYGAICLEAHSHGQYVDLLIDSTDADLSITVSSLQPPEIKVINLSNGFPVKTTTLAESPWATR